MPSLEFWIGLIVGGTLGYLLFAFMNMAAQQSRREEHRPDAPDRDWGP